MTVPLASAAPPPEPASVVANDGVGDAAIGDDAPELENLGQPSENLPVNAAREGGGTSKGDKSEQGVFDAAVQEADRASRAEVIEAEPYKHLYAARGILEQAKERVENNTLRARLESKIGANQYLCEENSDAEKNLLAAVSTLEGEENWSQLVAAWEASNTTMEAVGFPTHLGQHALGDLIVAYNWLGVLWTHRAEGNDKGCNYLARARSVMEEASTRLVPIKQLEEAYTETLYFLAQIKVSQGKVEEGAELCSETLRRQAQFGHSFEPMRWCTDCIGLATVFGVQLGATARGAHFLSAGERALLQAFEELRGSDGDILPMEDIILLENESLVRLVADLYRSRGNLYSNILERASMMDDSRLQGRWASKTGQSELSKSQALDDHFQLDSKPLSVQDITTSESAIQVFKISNSAFEKAKLFYVLDGHATDHIEILKSQSQLFRMLTTFESDTKRIAAMHGRREKLLEGLLEKLSPEHFAVQHQEISFELGSAAAAALRAKRQRFDVPLHGSGNLSQADMKKVNDSAFKAVKYFKHYIKAFEDAEEKDRASGHGDSTPEELASYIRAHFYLAHACHHMVWPSNMSGESRITWSKTCLQHYIKAHSLFDRIPEDFEELQAERSICSEAVDLLRQEVSLLETHLQ